MRFPNTTTEEVIARKTMKQVSKQQPNQQYCGL